MRKRTQKVVIKSWHILVLIFSFTILLNIVEYQKYMKDKKLSATDDYLTELNNTSFHESISTPLCFVLFYVDDFKWCDIMISNLSSLAKDESYVADYYKMNLNEYPEYDVEYNISGTPNILVFSYGKEIKRIMGVVSTPNLKRIYDKIDKEYE